MLKPVITTPMLLVIAGLGASDHNATQSCVHAIARVGRIGAQLPVEIFQDRILLSALLSTTSDEHRVDHLRHDQKTGYALYHRFSDALGGVPAGFVREVRSVEDGIQPEQNRLAKIYMLGDLSVMGARSTLRAMIARTPQKNGVYESRLWADSTHVDAFIDRSRRTHTGDTLTINPQDEHAINLFAQHARAVLMRQVLQPALARVFNCQRHEVADRVAAEWAMSAEQLQNDFRFWADQFVTVPVFNALSEFTRDQHSRMLLKYITYRYDQKKGVLNIQVKPSDQVSSDYRFVPQGLSPAFFQALHKTAPHMQEAFEGHRCSPLREIHVSMTSAYFPASVAYLADTLTQLRVDGLNAHTLPDGIGRLKNLKQLELKGKLHTLPEAITHLVALRGKKCLTLPVLEHISHSEDMAHFLVDTTQALSPVEYVKLSGVKLARSPKLTCTAAFKQLIGYVGDLT